MMFLKTDYFHASIIASADLSRLDKFSFMQLQEIADLKSTPYLKYKPVTVLDQDIFLVSIKTPQGKAVGQCLLTDAENPKTAYVSAYLIKGRTLALTSLFMNAGHGTKKGSIPEGLGPTSTLFKLIDVFATQNKYDAIIAKTHADNEHGRALFEKTGFTPSSPIIADNESYTSIFYMKELIPEVAM